MTASTQILPFCTVSAGSGGNRLTPSAYAALTSLLADGFQAGTALSVQVNTVLAQASFMAAMIANFEVAQGVTQNDDGNLSAAVTNFQTALAGFISSSNAGKTSNVQANLATAGASVTVTADVVNTSTAFNTPGATVTAYSQTLNVATTGAGGMDTGSAPTSGFVAVYAIQGASGNSILAQSMATSGAGSRFYSGAHLPTGYTNSCLLGVWPTNGSAVLQPGIIRDNEFFWQSPVAVFTNAAGVVSFTSQTISAAIPSTARTASGLLTVATAGTPTGSDVAVASDGSGTAQQGGTNTVGGSITNLNPGAQFRHLPITVAQTLYWRAGNNQSSSSNLSVNSFTF